MTNETLNVLLNRRSCRAFKSDMITEEELQTVLKAGTYAPTGAGKQAVTMIAITNKELRDKFMHENCKIATGDPDKADVFYGAPVIIAVLADKSWPTSVYDGSLVIGNMLNAAQSIGLGGIWIHRCKEEFESDFGKNLLKELGIEGEYEGVGHVALGYAAAEPKEAAPRKEGWVHYVR